MEAVRVSETSGCLLLYGADTQKEDQRPAWIAKQIYTENSKRKSK